MAEWWTSLKPNNSVFLNWWKDFVLLLDPQTSIIEHVGQSNFLRWIQEYLLYIIYDHKPALQSVQRTTASTLEEGFH